MVGAQMTDSNDILVGNLAGKTIGDGLIVLPGQGNSLAASTDDGVVVLDVSSPRHAKKMLGTLRDFTKDPVHAIVYSHGHHGYNSAVPIWLEHNNERGDTPPRLVGHENIVERYARYRETNELQARLASLQFPTGVPVEMVMETFTVHDPTETFTDTMELVGGNRRVELVWAPSEVHDAIAMWFPDDGLLCGGAATPGISIPNIGTPLRTQRFTIRWAETLERLDALGAETLLTEFGPLVEGTGAVHEQLSLTAEALRWLREEVVGRMNRGMGEIEIVYDMSFPEELFGKPWMLPIYGDPEYIVRDLFREESGWWDRNPTSLHPSLPSDAASAVLSAITDRDAVIKKAEELRDGGEIQLALHVIDLIALAEGEDAIVIQARELKTELLRLRGKEVTAFVSKSLYESSARLLENGETSWTTLK